MRDGDGSLPESVPEPAPDGLEVSHAAGAGHLSADRPLGPGANPIKLILA